MRNDIEPSPQQLEKLNRLIESGPFEVHVALTFPLDKAADAHRELDKHFWANRPCVRHFSEGPVTIVLVEDICPAISGHEQIQQTIVVEIASGAAGKEALVIDDVRLSDLREGGLPASLLVLLRSIGKAFPTRMRVTTSASRL